MLWQDVESRLQAHLSIGIRLGSYFFFLLNCECSLLFLRVGLKNWTILICGGNNSVGFPYKNIDIHLFVWKQ